jgi:hypothetical protein
MLIEATEKALRVKRPAGDILLTPGRPVEFTEADGLKLLVKARGKVRLVGPSETVIEPAHPNARPVYCERNDGVIYGPATVTDLARTGSGAKERFWVIVEFDGQLAWIRSDRLRSQRDFDRQEPQRTR